MLEKIPIKWFDCAIGLRAPDGLGASPWGRLDTDPEGIIRNPCQS